MVSRRDLPSESQTLPTVMELLDCLQSSLSTDIAEDDNEQSLRFIEGDNLFTDRFTPLFFSSLANNLIGLESIPVEAIMSFISHHKDVRSRIMKCLQQSSIFGRALAENLLRSAIEAGDATVVSFLLESTGRLVDPNTIVCMHGGRRWTPVERAARLCNLDVVQCLLKAGADVNKTCSTDTYDNQGALECAIQKWGDYVPVNLNLVKAILDGAAIVRAPLLGAIIRWGDNNVVAELISYLHLADHTDYMSNWILSDAAQHLCNEIGFRVVQQVLHACRDMHDVQCLGHHQHQFELAMFWAARKANMELVQLLIPHVVQEALDHALSAAVASRCRQTVYLLLDKGARVGADAIEPQYVKFRRHPTTPLAEAIRVGDDDLILYFERNGALVSMREGLRLEAALCAISEVGTCRTFRNSSNCFRT